MLGGQQIRAYKTIMKGSRYLPRHTDTATALYRAITWGALIVVAGATIAIVAGKVASYGFTTEPAFLIAIPIALVLLFFWWWIDVAPTVSRVLVALAGVVAGILCIHWAMDFEVWEKAQIAAVVLYLIGVSGFALRQALVNRDEEPEGKRM